MGVLSTMKKIRYPALLDLFLKNCNLPHGKTVMIFDTNYFNDIQHCQFKTIQKNRDRVVINHSILNYL